MRIREKLKAKLLVEGNDDHHVVWAPCKKYDILQNFEVVDCEGITKLLDQLPTRLRLESNTSVGVLLDADHDSMNRWKSLQDQLVRLDYYLPEHPNPSGTIIESSSYYPRLGIWLMPDNLQSSGMLEDFAKVLIPEGDELIAEVERVLAVIEAMPRKALYKDIYRAKAFIHTWLAWQEDPGTPMGLAITKSYLNHNHELAARFVTWLNTLFNPIQETSNQ